MQDATVVEPHYTIPETARRWGFPESQLYRAIRRGDLKAFRPKGARKGWLTTDKIMADFMAQGMEVAGESK